MHRYPGLGLLFLERGSNLPGRLGTMTSGGKSSSGEAEARNRRASMKLILLTGTF